ncbi:hypothetical protein WA026_021521 [Henosepilachna vigintioctopunctata]|uniref:Uncharacterized protein n=1 Tax=Henosepilachna vigintioctopunctata TaxID=420089 RepID=A0AAW1VIA7_9CUCU
MDVHGSIRQRADAAWNISCLEPFSRVKQELLRKAWRHKICSYDPVELVRKERLQRRSDWNENRISRIKRSNLGYDEVKNLGFHFTNQDCRSATYQKYVVTEELLCSMLFDVPLNLWCKQFSESMTSVRRSLILGDLVSPELLALMKLMNVTIRCLERPDMKVEHWNRSTIIPRKVMLNAVGEAWPISAYSVYGKKFVEKFKTVLINTSVDAPIDMKFGKIGKKMIKKYIINEMSLLRDALDEIIRWTPQKRAYYFLKPEPWHKQRALYATYDEESFVSAYANAGIENQMSNSPGASDIFL